MADTLVVDMQAHQAVDLISFQVAALLGGLFWNEREERIAFERTLAHRTAGHFLQVDQVSGYGML